MGSAAWRFAMLRYAPSSRLLRESCWRCRKPRHDPDGSEQLDACVSTPTLPSQGPPPWPGAFGSIKRTWWKANRSRVMFYGTRFAGRWAPRLRRWVAAHSVTSPGIRRWWRRGRASILCWAAGRWRRLPSGRIQHHPPPQLSAAALPSDFRRGCSGLIGPLLRC